VKFRKKAEVLLTALKKKNRFVEVSLKDEVQATCKNKPCQQCIRIATIYSPPAILASQGCNQCAQAQLALFPSVEVVDVAEYSISDFFDSYLKPRDHLLNRGEWTQHEFEQEILIPLLRDAKDVKIYDRYIGRSILQKKNAATYKFTLKWIIDVFVRERSSKFKGVFEVYGGVNTCSIPKPKRPNAVAALRKLESDLRQFHPAFKLIIKDETQGGEMPHDRFLVTNQVAVSVGRGFNLLFGSNPRLVKDVTIAYCSEPGKIEQAVQTLPNL
jgi:hypothetical protein